MLNVAGKFIAIWKTLRSSTFTDCDYPILFRVKAHPHLAHWLRVSNGGWEVPFPIQPSKQTLPLVVPVCCVRQAPGNQINHLSSRQFNLLIRQVSPVSTRAFRYFLTTYQI
uniref:Uncharacterized protein n=1 Tax=Opuntia streptacantha TaxID=393608 RepID=A0A7C8ZBB6_OPUST